MARGRPVGGPRTLGSRATRSRHERVYRRFAWRPRTVAGGVGRVAPGPRGSTGGSIAHPVRVVPGGRAVWAASGAMPAPDGPPGRADAHICLVGIALRPANVARVHVQSTLDRHDAHDVRTHQPERPSHPLDEEDASRLRVRRDALEARRLHARGSSASGARQLPGLVSFRGSSASGDRQRLARVSAPTCMPTPLLPRGRR